MNSNLACLKEKEVNPFTKKCVKKCKRGTKRNKDDKRKKFVCFKLCKKGSVRNPLTNRCKKSKTTPSSYQTARETSSEEYFTPKSKPTSQQSLQNFYDNESSNFSHYNEMRKGTPSLSTRSLQYLYDDNSPDFSYYNEMQKRSPSLSSKSLDYVYDNNSPDFSDYNEMRLRG